MISWTEKIKQRARKETAIVPIIAPSVPVDFYQQALERSLSTLNDLEKRFLFLRFWLSLTIAEVASETGTTWEYADRQIDFVAHKVACEMLRLAEVRSAKVD